MQYYRQLLVHFISLRHVSHHHIICIHSNWLIDPNVTYSSRSRQNFQNKYIASPDYCATQQGIYKLLWGSFDQRVLLNREGVEWNIWTIYIWTNYVDNSANCCAFVRIDRSPFRVFTCSSCILTASSARVVLPRGCRWPKHRQKPGTRPTAVELNTAINCFLF